MAQHGLDISILENMIVGGSKLLSEAETLVTWGHPEKPSHEKLGKEIQRRAMA
jgi:hypothetical protein